VPVMPASVSHAPRAASKVVAAAAAAGGPARPARPQLLEGLCA
jgi:hypothetical protein